MLDLLFIFSFLLFPLLVLIFLKYLRLSFFQISLPSMVILFMFVFAYIGILPLYFGLVRATGTYEEKLLFTMVFFGAAWSIMGLLAGFAFSRSVLGLRIKSPRMKTHPLNKGDMLGFVVLLCISFFVLLLYLSKIERIALFVALRDGFTESKIARSTMGNAFEGHYHWYRLFFSDALSFITFAFWSNWLLFKRKSSLLLFLFSFSLTSFAALMTTQKSPFAWLIIGLFLTYFLTRKFGRVPLKSIALFFSSIIIILSAMYIIFMGSINWQSGAISVFSRAFTGQITPAAFYLEVFPEQKDFLLGQTLPNPGGILPFTPYQYTVELMNMRFPHLQEAGIVGSMPTAFWGEAYINFGWFGVFVIPVILGTWIWIVAYMLEKMKNSPIKIASTVLLILHFKGISGTGFSKFFIDIGLISLFSILSLALLFGNVLSNIIIFRKHV